MKMINVVNGPQNVSAIIQGCMRMPALSPKEAAEVIRTAYDCGVNFYDHATCYGKDGEAETRFCEAFPLTGIRREDVVIQSKCGICPERSEFDWTKENILSSVDDSLRRLNTEYLDTPRRNPCNLPICEVDGGRKTKTFNHSGGGTFNIIATSSIQVL